MRTPEQKKVINRLKSMYPLRAKVNETYQNSLQAIKAGKPAVWAMLSVYYGEPILKAMDLEVVYPENYGAALAATGVAQLYLDRADADGFPDHLCGYCRASLGYTSRMKELDGEIPPEAPLAGMPKPLFLLSSVAICDARHKMFQAMGRYMDVPVWTLEAPIPGVKEFFTPGCYERMVRFGVEHLRQFIAFIEYVVGRKMNWDKLAEVVDLMIEINRIWHEINELRRTKPCPMHSRDFWSAMPAALFLAGNLKDSLQCYKNMYDEVRDRVKSQTGAIPEEKYRLVLAEIPPWHSLDFFERLAERGWNFVIESFAYHPPIPLDLSGVNDPLERITRFSLQKILAYYCEARDQNMPPTACPYLRYAKEWRCDGALLHSVLTCRSASFNLPFLSNMLAEKLKVPSLTIQGDIVDLRLFNTEDALARAEPFEEAMEYHRRIRKQEGLDW